MNLLANRRRKQREALLADPEARKAEAFKMLVQARINMADAMCQLSLAEHYFKVAKEATGATAEEAEADAEAFRAFLDTVDPGDFRCAP